MEEIGPGHGRSGRWGSREDNEEHEVGYQFGGGGWNEAGGIVSAHGANLPVEAAVCVFQQERALSLTCISERFVGFGMDVHHAKGMPK